MSLTRRGLLVFTLTSVVAACSSVVPPMANTRRSTGPNELSQSNILAAINGTRRANGKPPLRYNSALEVAARRQARLMADKDQLSHNLGVTLRQRVSDAGYEGAVGENVAGGQLTLEQAIDGWLHSPAHRETLLSTKFVEFGLAEASVSSGRKSKYRNYWTFIAGGPFAAWYN